MLWRLALLVLCAMILAFDFHPKAEQAARHDPPEEPRPAPLSERQLQERSAQCARTSHDEFRRGWSNAATGPAQDKPAAEYLPYYNARLDTCFLLLTVNGPQTLVLRLYDVIERELYGEYLGPAVDESPMRTAPDLCRVTAYYCGSRREWEALARNFIGD